MKILVAIANYGTKSRVYLERLLAEYRSLPYQVDVVVLSNIPKDLGPDVEVRVGLPDKNPWSLPFGHKQLFADRLDDYDLFIYSEDDMLIGRRQIEAFLEVTPFLPDDQIAGFLQYEEDAHGKRYCPAVHAFCHWVPRSVRQCGPYVFAYLTNEHAACYLLTRAQLRRAIASGGFLGPPHQGFYDLLCTAATDPYTQCGFTKVLCLSRIEDFLVHHVPNKYLGTVGLEFDQVRVQIEALHRCLRGELTCEELLPPPGKPSAYSWSKLYGEPVREDVLSVVPKGARRVLSLGCGTGATEAVLVQRGMQVIGIPLDAVVGQTARTRGLELTPPNFEKAFALLRGQRFDCILLINILQHLSDPSALLAQSRPLLAERGTLVAAAPNVGFLGHWRRQTAGMCVWRGRDAFARFQVHHTVPRMVTGWIRRSGLRVTCLKYDENARWGWLTRAFPRLTGPWLSRKVVVVASPVLSGDDG